MALAGMAWGAQPYVPDATVAVKIAEAVAIPVYGEKRIKAELPLTASLEDGVWKVEGHFDYSAGKKGGVVEVKLRKSTGEILSLTHGR